MSVTLYGIPNCDSVKKARGLLDAAGVAYVFHDYKKLGAPEALLRQWVAARGVDVVLNRKGTTWRALDEAAQSAAADEAGAVALMCAQPSSIKRPIVVSGTRLAVGLEELGALLA
jgi:arsenate reductase